MKKLLMISAILLITLASAQAQSTVNSRQRAQRVRIAEGRADGDLTNREAALLNKQQRHIRRAEACAKADGQVTMSEQKMLHRKQKRANHAIRRAKHNPIEKQG
jgi:hypothetical protein